jgi:hypothetical protein
MDKINIWKTLVVHVVWNKPPNIPIPLFKNTKFKLSYVIKLDITKIVIVTLEYKMDLSRLKVIELDNNNKSSVKMIMFSQERNLNSHY